MIKGFWGVSLNVVSAMEADARRLLPEREPLEMYAYGFTVGQIFIGVVVRKRKKKILEFVGETREREAYQEHVLVTRAIADKMRCREVERSGCPMEFSSEVNRTTSQAVQQEFERKIGKTKD